MTLKRLKVTALLVLTTAGIATHAGAGTKRTMQPYTYADVTAYAPRVADETAKLIQTPTEAAMTSVRPYSANVSYWEGNCPDFEGYAEPRFTESEIEMLAKTVYGEAGICSAEEQRLVVWTVLQRVDAGGFGGTITDVITAPNQFIGYNEQNPIDPDIYELCAAEAADWSHGTKPPTLEPYALTTPYLYFDGDGQHNWFREGWER